MVTARPEQAAWSGPDEADREVVIDLQGIVTRFGSQTVHDGLDLQIRRGHLLGTDVWKAPQEALAATRRRFGMMFQEGALFSSLSVADNVATPIREHLDLPETLVDELVRLRLSLAGLPPDAGAKMPSQLSGGMRKRAAIARAIALEPEVLFLDEPTSGLDPITARAFDALLEFLNRDLGITVLVVTHDLDTLFGIARRIIVLGQGKVIADGSLQAITQTNDPWIQSYFSSRATMNAGESATQPPSQTSARDGA